MERGRGTVGLFDWVLFPQVVHVVSTQFLLHHLGNAHALTHHNTPSHPHSEERTAADERRQPDGTTKG